MIKLLRLRKGGFHYDEINDWCKRTGKSFTLQTGGAVYTLAGPKRRRRSRYRDGALDPRRMETPVGRDLTDFSTVIFPGDRAVVTVRIKAPLVHSWLGHEVRFRCGRALCSNRAARARKWEPQLGRRSPHRAPSAPPRHRRQPDG